MFRVSQDNISRKNSRSGARGVFSAARSFAKDINVKVTRQVWKNPNALRFVMNAWPPLLGAGIRIAEISPDWRYARIELRVNKLTANMHGAAFGGSLYSMTDFMFGTLVARVMGAGYEAWTRTGTFQYLSPGRDGAYLEIKFSEAEEQWVRQTVEQDGYCNVPYTCVVKNADGSIAGIGQQDLHVRPRGGGRRSDAPQQARSPRGLVLEAMATTLVWHVFRDRPDILTVLMSEQRRIANPEDQMKHVCKTVLEKSERTREDLIALDIPERFLP